MELKLLTVQTCIGLFVHFNSIFLCKAHSKIEFTDQELTELMFKPKNHQVVVNVGLVIDYIGLKNKNFEIVTGVDMTWHDPRLKSPDAEDQNRCKMEVLQERVLQKIWLPEFAIRNMIGGSAFHEIVVRGCENGGMELSTRANLMFMYPNSIFYFPMDRMTFNVELHSFSYYDEEVSFKWTSKEIDFDDIMETGDSEIDLPTVKLKKYEFKAYNRSVVRGVKGGPWKSRKNGKILEILRVFGTFWQKNYVL